MDKEIHIFSMEPMTLGSPVGSPSTPSPTSPYLPGFLIGDPTPQPPTPTKTPRQVHFAPNLSSAVLTPSGTPQTSTSLNDSLSRFHKSQREKSGGPPTVGLFDTLEVSIAALSTPPVTASLTPGQLSHSQGMPTTPMSGQSIPNKEELESWVTVFGFPPSAASSVLGQFSQVGHVVEHRFPGQGNWINICYATRLDARRALSYNGKILGGQIMIGVIPSKDFMQPQPGSVLQDMTNMVSPAGPSTPASPQVSRMSSRRLVTSPTSPYLTSPRPGRPLASPTDKDVVAAQNTPTKNTSFMTKAVDFVFGW